MSSFQYVSLVEPIVASGEAITEEKWHQPWCDPVRQSIAPQLAVALIASGLAFVEAAPFAEAVTEDRWHLPWSEPVRATPRLPEGQQQLLAPDPLPRVSFGWWAPLGEPVRVRPALPTGEQQAPAFTWSPATVSVAWFAALSEPIRLRPGLPAGEQQVLALQPWPDISVAWWQPLAEPVRIEPALPAPDQQVLALFPQPIPVAAGGGGWDLPRPDVERIRRRLRQDGLRKIEPEREPPTFAAFLRTWTPPPFVVVDDLVRKPRPAPQQAPAVLPEQQYPDRLRAIAASLDDHEDMQAITAAIDALPDAAHEAVRRLIEDHDDMTRINEFIGTLD
jgi:hypothetical protein